MALPLPPRRVREALFTSNELDALRRHNQALVDTKTGLESQLETCHARLSERSRYVTELEAKVRKWPSDRYSDDN